MVNIRPEEKVRLNVKYISCKLETFLSFEKKSRLHKGISK